MINFSFSRRKSNEAVASSGLFDEHSFYGAFERDLRRAKKTVLIESPFLSVSRSVQLVKIFKKLHKRGVQVYLYTREPQHHPPHMRKNSLESINILKRTGITIYACSDYRHRKVAIIDKKLLWEGSLNILSQSKSRETMRRIDSVALAKQMLRIVKG